MENNDQRRKGARDNVYGSISKAAKDMSPIPVFEDALHFLFLPLNKNLCVAVAVFQAFEYFLTLMCFHWSLVTCVVSIFLVHELKISLTLMIVGNYFFLKRKNYKSEFYLIFLTKSFLFTWLEIKYLTTYIFIFKKLNYLFLLINLLIFC